MPQYVYEAVSAQGQRITDEGQFDSPAVLYRQLREQGYTLVSYRKKRPILGLNFFSPKIKRKELAEFLRNLGLLLKGGVPLVDALTDFLRSPGVPALKLIIKDVIQRIKAGELFSEALSHHKKAIPKIVTILIQIGEETGRLDKTLEDAAAHLERVQEIIDKTKRAVSYPAVIILAMLGALAFWMLYVLPKLLELFKTLGLKELPFATQLLLSLVNLAQRYWFVVPMLVAIVALFGFLSTRSIKVKRLWDRLWIKVPIIGIVIRYSQLAFFFEYLSLLTASGIDTIKSLAIMESAITHQLLRQGVGTIRQSVLAGSSLSEAFNQCEFFEPFILRMVKVGEQTGNMPEQLKILSSYYMDRVNRLVDSVAKGLEPVLIGVAGIIFVLIVMGLLGPIYDMMGKIR